MNTFEFYNICKIEKEACEFFKGKRNINERGDVQARTHNEIFQR